MIYVRAEKIPGQKKISTSMTSEQKLEIARQNEETRRKAIEEASRKGVRVHLTGKFLNLGIPEGGYYDDKDEVHRKQIIDTATKPPPKEAPKAKEAPKEAPKAKEKPKEAPKAKETHEEPVIERPPTHRATLVPGTTPPQVELSGPAVTPIAPTPPLTELRVYYKGVNMTLILYTDLSQLMARGLNKTEYTIQLRHYLADPVIEIKAANEAELWGKILSIMGDLSHEEHNDIYRRSISLYRRSKGL